MVCKIQATVDACLRPPMRRSPAARSRRARRHAPCRAPPARPVPTARAACGHRTRPDCGPVRQSSRRHGQRRAASRFRVRSHDNRGRFPGIHRAGDHVATRLIRHTGMHTTGSRDFGQHQRRKRRAHVVDIGRVQRCVQRVAQLPQQRRIPFAAQPVRIGLVGVGIPHGGVGIGQAIDHVQQQTLATGWISKLKTLFLQFYQPARSRPAEDRLRDRRRSSAAATIPPPAAFRSYSS